MTLGSSRLGLLNALLVLAASLLLAPGALAATSTPATRSAHPHAESAVRAPTPYLRFIEHACDVTRNNLDPKLAVIIGDFTGATHRARTRTKVSRSHKL